MRITEIYHSIQGESRYAGLPCVFVRTTGCNLRCNWCDTEYAFDGGEEMTVREIVERVEGFDCMLVEITGGEPLLQKETPALAESLLDHGRTVLVETSGERDISVLDARAVRIMDIKCPGSGESERNRWQNIAHLTNRDEVKFVIADRADYDWAVRVVHEHDLPARTNVIFSPVFGGVELRDLASWILRDALDVRFQLQLHKFIWAPDAKGV